MFYHLPVAIVQPLNLNFDAYSRPRLISIREKEKRLSISWSAYEVMKEIEIHIYTTYLYF